MTSGETNASVGAQVYQYLLLGQEGCCFMVGARPGLQKGLQFVENVVSEGKGVELVQELLKHAQNYSTCEDARICVLAMCARSTDAPTKEAAYTALAAVCQTGEELLKFVHYSEKLSKANGGTGWGRAQRKAIDRWYNEKKPMDLLVACTKFPTCQGWSHQDVLRLAHVKAVDKVTAVVIQYLNKGLEETLKEYETDEVAQDVSEILTYIKTLDKLKHTTDEQEATFLIRSQEFGIEHTPTRLRKSIELWHTLLPKTPLQKILVHLRRFAQLGFLAPSSLVLPLILEQLQDKDKLSDSKIQPIDVFLAMKKYEDQGGKLVAPTRPKRRPTNSVIDALHNLFVSSLQNVPATGKRFLIAVDVRNPMVHGRVQGCAQLTPALASALLILPLLYAEESVTVAAFSTKSLIVLDLKKDMSLLDITKCMRETPMGPIDCAMPMVWANQTKKPFDVFLILTDNQVKRVNACPIEALKKYRQEQSVPQARLIVTALALRGFNLASPQDPGMLDIGGFDVHVPQVISNFVLSPF